MHAVRQNLGTFGEQTGAMAVTGHYVRRASHAGSWYTNDGESLNEQLSGWLSDAPTQINDPPRAIIAPHAGFSYSGSTAAHAYSYLVRAATQTTLKRVFVLGPSHHVYIRGCAVSGATQCHTPLGPLEVDQIICDQLLSAGPMELMTMGMDEDEHSIEMQLPYIAKALQEAGSTDTKIVPIMVGNLTEDDQLHYGELLGPFLDDPGNFFVISSDFCHWGARFSYAPHDSTYGRRLAIWEFIKAMDMEGIECIESQDPSKFSKYLKKTKNTICGRFPISVLMSSMLFAKVKFEVHFVAYNQSSKAQSKSDSSVSYASAVVCETPIVHSQPDSSTN